MGVAIMHIREKTQGSHETDHVVEGVISHNTTTTEAMEGALIIHNLIMAMHMAIKRVMRQRMENLYATDATNQAIWLENVQLSWTIAVGV